MRVRDCAAGPVVFVAVMVVAACSSGSSDTKSTTPATNASTTAPRPESKELPGTTLTGDVAFLGPIRTVPVGGLTMAFRQFGQGPDLLMIAGQASGMSVWPRTTLAALAERHRVTIYDNRDLGATATTTKAFTLPDLADDAAGLIAALGLSHPAVFGWSTGGEIGLLLAVRHRDVLSSLAVTGATPGGPKSVLPPPEIIELFASATPDTTKLLDVLFSPSGAAAQGAFIVDYAKVPQPTLTADAAAKYDAAEREYWRTPEPDLGSIKVPVLVMNGSDDYAVPPANANYIAGRIGPKATLELDAVGRHAWFIEHPDHFEKALSSFLG
jgi:pimeloyl-ACP methyl ester carboxylesterase